MEGVFALPASVRPSIRKLSSCPHDTLSQIWAWITKFAPNMHHWILPAFIENRGHRPWPWRTFWPFWLRVLENSACLHDNSSQIYTWINKVAPIMHHVILSFGIENIGHWPWISKSFWPIENSTCPYDYSSYICVGITKFTLSMHPVILSTGVLRNLFVRAIKCNGCELESPNLHQIFIFGFFRLILKMGVIDLDLQDI